MQLKMYVCAELPSYLLDTMFVGLKSILSSHQTGPLIPGGGGGGVLTYYGKRGSAALMGDFSAKSP